MPKVKRSIKFMPFLIIILFLSFMTYYRIIEQEETELQIKRTLNLKLKNVLVQPLQKGDVTDYILAQGRTEPIKTLLIKSEVTKKLTNIYVQLGQWVQKGDLMFCFDESDAVVSFIDAKSAHQKARANYEYFKQDYENKLELSQKGFIEITEDILNQSKLAFETHSASFEQAKAGLIRAENDLRRTLIFAPFTGVVTELFYETEDEFVSVNSPLAKVSDLTSIKVSVGVANDDIIYITEGRAVNILDLGRQILEVEGKITGISAQADETGTFAVQAVIKNPNFKIPMTFIEDFGYEARHADIGGIITPKPKPRIPAHCKSFDLLNIKPKLPPLNTVNFTQDNILGNEVCRIRIDKSIIKDSFIVPANVILRIDSVDYICIIERKKHLLTTFGQEDYVNIAQPKFIPVKVHLYVHNEAIISSHQLQEDIWLVIEGQKSLTPSVSELLIQPVLQQ